MTEQEFLKQKADLETMLVRYEQARTTWGEKPKTLIEDTERMLANHIAKWEKQNSSPNSKSND